jgi:hypothetical protein
MDNLIKGSDDRELYLNTTYVLNELAPKKYIFDTLIGMFSEILAQLESQDDLKVVATCKIVSIIIG